MTKNATLMFVAGEASGDKHGAALAHALSKLHPDISFEIFGAGGDDMRLAGVETLVDARDVAIIGIPEIIGALGRLYRAYRSLLDAARQRRPQAVVLIDWPDFNLRLARRLHGDGFRVIYYISPQVWAWRRYRVHAIRRDVDKMLVILPFEAEFYAQHQIKVEYVGHPLVNAVSLTRSREEFSRRHGLDPARPYVALLPGSRQKEVHYHLPAMLDAASRMRDAWESVPDLDLQPAARLSSEFEAAPSALNVGPPSAAVTGESSRRPSPQFLLPLASTVQRGQVDAIFAQSGFHSGDDAVIIEGDTYNALGHSTLAVVASGTATVEAALLGIPMVIVYRGSEVNWRLIRPLIHLDTFGMVNLIAGRRIMPELLQREVTGKRIAAEALAILADPHRLSEMRKDLLEVGARLKTESGSGAERAARALSRAVGLEPMP